MDGIETRLQTITFVKIRHFDGAGIPINEPNIRFFISWICKTLDSNSLRESFGFNFNRCFQLLVDQSQFLEINGGFISVVIQSKSKIFNFHIGWYQVEHIRNNAVSKFGIISFFVRISCGFVFFQESLKILPVFVLD